MNAERKLERVAERLAQYSEGASAHAVGLELGISAASVMRLVRKHGFEPHERVLSDDVIREAAQLYESGLSLHRAADRDGTNKWTIRRALIDAGVQLRPRLRLHPHAKPLTRQCPTPRATGNAPMGNLIDGYDFRNSATYYGEL